MEDMAKREERRGSYPVVGGKRTPYSSCIQLAHTPEEIGSCHRLSWLNQNWLSASSQSCRRKSLSAHAVQTHVDTTASGSRMLDLLSPVGQPGDEKPLGGSKVHRSKIYGKLCVST